MRCLPNANSFEILSQVELYRSLESALGSNFSSEPISPTPHPLIIVISGPSGVGKDAVIKVMIYLHLLCMEFAFF